MAKRLAVSAGLYHDERRKRTPGTVHHQVIARVSSRFLPLALLAPLTKSRLDDAEDETKSDELAERVDGLEGDRHASPDQHDSGQEEGRPRARQDHVGWNFKEEVADEEDEPVERRRE